MKKFLVATALAGCVMGASAQNLIERPTFGDNWNIGVDAGVTTPLKGHSFLQNMRPVVGAHFGKQLTPLFGVGVEGLFGINTSAVNGQPHSRTVFDTSYVGGYGTFNLTNAFMGFTCGQRPFGLEAVAGIGWSRDYIAHHHDPNDIDAKFGLNFNFNVSDNFSIALKPSVNFNLTGNDSEYKNVGFNAKRADFNMAVGFNYNFGPGFECVVPVDYTVEIATLNDGVNQLRAQVERRDAALAAAQARNAQLEAALAAAQAKPAKVIKENTLSSVRYVFFKIGSSVITPDQMPNVEMIAAYLKNHPKSKVQIRGYASPDGSIEVNERLAAARAESVKNSLMKKYNIPADRIDAKGEGIGTMFSEESWNRVSICTLED